MSGTGMPFAQKHLAMKLALAMLLPALLAACGDTAPPPAAEEPRPVRVITVEPRRQGDAVTLSGTVQAQTEVSLAFRINGRMVERLVNVGDRVRAGQPVARLDRADEENALRAARASLTAAQAQVAEARNNHWRQRELLATGFTTRVRYDQATQVLRSAEAQVDAAQAQVSLATDRLAYTVLYADAAGTVVARGAEPGEVVAAGRMIVQLAREDGRDAVFDVPAQVKDQAPAAPVIEVTLATDAAIRALGRVREVSPQADPVTGTFRVRVGLDSPPPGLRLGSAVAGRMEIGPGGGVEVPASALTRAAAQPAVWVVDPGSRAVALRPVEVIRFDPARVLVGQGLESGDIVVTAGVQALRPGQRVRLLGAQP
jgi:RND family efflux transporter MFP subunit